MRKILIVDDEEGIVKLLSKLLTVNGYECICASTGKEAIELAVAEKPKVVLLDLLLDDMPGLVVMRQIKDKLVTVECIVVTGRPSRSSAVSAVNLGAYGFISKPWSDEELLIMIRSALRHAEMAEALVESEQRYRQLAESAQDLIFTVGTDMKVSYVNGKSAAFLKIEPEKLIGMHIKDVFGGGDVSSQQANLEKVMKHGESIIISDKYNFANVACKLSVRLSPLRNECGEIVGVHGISRVIE